MRAHTVIALLHSQFALRSAFQWMKRVRPARSGPLPAPGCCDCVATLRG